MRETPVLLVALLLALPAAAAADCAAARQAHEALLAESFDVRRTFRISINDDLKKREVARLTYRSGALETEVLEDEVLSKGLVFEAEGKDFALAIAFDCARLEGVGDGRFELTSEDGLEVATFAFDPERGAWRPVAWRMDATERFLFKKFVIEGRAEYDEFAWAEPAPIPAPEEVR